MHAFIAAAADGAKTAKFRTRVVLVHFAVPLLLEIARKSLGNIAVRNEHA